MSKITIYHGSCEVIKRPEFGKGKPYNDYGLGFYCTEHIELAKEWACGDRTDGYANKYLLDTEKLKVLNLSSNEYTVLNWLAILVKNRLMNVYSPVMKRGKEYLIENFLPDYESYDIIIGYRADDSYFSFARAFLSNEISLGQLEIAMRLGKLGEQIVLKSEKAFESIEFVDFSVATGSVYYAKRKARDEEAKSAYLKELENLDANGLFMRDIILQEIKPNDIRLR